MRDGVTDAELRRVKAQVLANQVFQLDSMFGQAMQLGVLDNAGLPPDSFALQARKLQEVTAAQVQEVARRFLVDDGLTVAVLEPERDAGGREPAATEPTP
jgi:zinc protease